MNPIQDVRPAIARLSGCAPGDGRRESERAYGLTVRACAGVCVSCSGRPQRHARADDAHHARADGYARLPHECVDAHVSP